MQVAHIESRALNAHLARTDRFAELDELSYTELQSLEDDLSEGSQWSLLDDVRAELRDRREDAKEALSKLFVEQCKVGGMLPMVVPAGALSIRAQLGTWTASAYLTESFGDAKWGSMVSDVLLGVIDRERLLRAMGEEYASMQAEDLLRAGYEVAQ
jgi:hypothetical protein